jgi:hypothetical protein
MTPPTTQDLDLLMATAEGWCILGPTASSPKQYICMEVFSSSRSIERSQYRAYWCDDGCSLQLRVNLLQYHIVPTQALGKPSDPCQNRLSTI